MNGFITESVSKISDGMINSIKLILIYALTTMLLIPIQRFFQRPGFLIYIFLILALAGFELQRSLAGGTSEPKRAWYGMAAGLYFWQVIRFTAELGSFQLFQQAGMIFWVMAVIMTAVMWKRILPTGLRTATVVLLVCWIGKLYQVGYTYLAEWPPIVNFGYIAIRYLAGVAGFVALLLIIFRSRDLNSRIYGAIAIFAAVLFVALAF
jgi:hypothetical protein